MDSWSAQAAKTEYHRWGGCNDGHLFLTVLERDDQGQGAGGSGSWGGLSSRCADGLLAASSFGGERDHLCCVSSYQGPSPIHGAPPSCTNYFPETPPPRGPKITLGTRTPTCEFWRDTHSVLGRADVYILTMLILTIHLETTSSTRWDTWRGSHFLRLHVIGLSGMGGDGQVACVVAVTHRRRTRDPASVHPVMDLFPPSIPPSILEVALSTHGVVWGSLLGVGVEGYPAAALLGPGSWDGGWGGRGNSTVCTPFPLSTSFQHRAHC